MKPAVSDTDHLRISYRVMEHLHTHKEVTHSGR